MSPIDPKSYGEALLRVRGNFKEKTLHEVHDMLIDATEMVENGTYESLSNRSGDNDGIRGSGDSQRETPLHGVSNNGRGR